MEKELSQMTQEELWKLFPIILKEHNTVYKNWYEEEKEAIIKNIGEKGLIRINHIGSSAVEGLLAKPTVDILLEIDKKCDIFKLIDPIKEMGWLLMQEQYDPEPHLAFNKGYTAVGFAEKVYHLHVRYFGDWGELYFRDYLREHRLVAIEYAELKQRLKKQYEYNRDAYTEAKTEFVTKYTKIAREYYKDRYKVISDMKREQR